MTAGAVALCVLSMFLSVIALSVASNESAERRSDRKALHAAENERDELKETLVAILDEEGNVRGRLRLPGEVAPATSCATLRTPVPSAVSAMNLLRLSVSCDMRSQLFISVRV